MRKHVQNNRIRYNSIQKWHSIYYWTPHGRKTPCISNGTHTEESSRGNNSNISDYTLWHRRMGHAHQRIIKHLDKNTEGGPHQTTNPPTGICEGCEMGKSKRLPFPSSKSRAKRPIDLVHSDLDEMSDLSIGRYKYTTTYLDDYSSFGVIFYLKKKSEEFATFKQYKAWAE